MSATSALDVADSTPFSNVRNIHRTATVTPWKHKSHASDCMKTRIESCLRSVLSPEKGRGGMQLRDLEEGNERRLLYGAGERKDEATLGTDPHIAPSAFS